MYTKEFTDYVKQLFVSKVNSIVELGVYDSHNRIMNTLNDCITLSEVVFKKLNLNINEEIELDYDNDEEKEKIPLVKVKNIKVIKQPNKTKNKRQSKTK